MQGLNETQMTNVFSDCVKPMKHKDDRSLSIKEHRNLFENLEHDRMLASNYNRQSSLSTIHQITKVTMITLFTMITG